MKIGIMTINSAYNYGCVLQAWSLQKFLEKEGHEAQIINYRLPEIDSVYVLFRNKKKFGFKPLNSLYNKLRHIKFNRTQAPRIKKAEKFEHFINEIMNTTPVVYTTYRELKENQAAEPYDILITGSDQVWNSAITKGLKPAYFLGFDQSKKKISYAASIGKTVLSKAESDFMKYYLKEYSHIAVREYSAQELLAPIVSDPVEVVLDPTLLLERKDFEAIKQPYKIDQPYILVHIIGEDKRLMRIVRRVAGQLGLPIVQNRMKKQYKAEIANFADAGPGEFLSLIENAEMVITNSFHATVFSIIYGRNFITVPHKTYPERMANLLKEAGLEDHLVKSVAYMYESNYLKRLEEARMEEAGELSETDLPNEEESSEEPNTKAASAEEEEEIGDAGDDQAPKARFEGLILTGGDGEYAEYPLLHIPEMPDYVEVYDRLKVRQQESRDYLRNAIKN